MFDVIGQALPGVVDFLEPIVLPDWQALIDLFPVFLLIGVVGPLLVCWSSAGSSTSWASPGRGSPIRPPPQPARIVDGRPIYPSGEPYCAVRKWSSRGRTRCEIDKGDLAVICPKCSTGRAAWIDTCGTCGSSSRSIAGSPPFDPPARHPEAPPPA